MAKLRPVALLLVLSCYEVTETGAVVPVGYNATREHAVMRRSPSAFGLAPVNDAADPCGDFAAYACGAEASWGKVQPESDLLAWRAPAIWRFLDELAAGKHQDGKPATALLKDLYTRCKDPRAREAGVDDLDRDLKRIDQARTIRELVTIVGELQRSGAPTLIRLVLSNDADSAETPFLARIDLTSFWLHGRKTSSKVAVIESVRGHWQRIAALTNALSPDEVTAALEVEAALDQEGVLGGTGGLDRPKPIQRPALASYRFPWQLYLDALGLPAAVPLAPARATTMELADYIATLPVAKLKSYVRLVLLERSARFLGESFLAQEAAFHRAETINGRPLFAEIAPLCVELTANVLETQLAAAYLPGLAQVQSEAIARQMFQAVRDRFGTSIDRAEWLDPITRRAIRVKVDALQLRLIEDTDEAAALTTKLPGGSLYAAMRHLGQSAWVLNVERITSHPDGSAMVAPSLEPAAFFARPNAIWLSPEIVRPPFLRGGMGDPISMGALGTTLGHEVAHMLSPSARRYDAAGLLHETWSPDGVRVIDRCAICLTRQEQGTRDTGPERYALPATADEALSDLVGVGLALRILQDSMAKDSADNLRTAQRQFFLSYAQMMCTFSRLSAAASTNMGDPHPPPRVRINATVANTAPFAAAFGCREGAPLAPRDRCGLQ